MSAAAFYHGTSQPGEGRGQHFARQEQQHQNYGSHQQQQFPPAHTANTFVLGGAMSFEDALGRVRSFLTQQAQGAQWDDSAMYAPELQHYEQLSQQYKQYKSTLHWNDLPPDLAESINRTDSTLSQLENSPTISTMTRHAIGFNMYHLVSAFQQCVQERGQLSPGDGGDMQFLMVQAGERATAQASQDHQAMQALRAFISEVPSLLQGDQSSYPAQQHDSIPAAAPASGYRFPHHPVTHGVGPSSGAYVSHGHSSHPLHGSGSTAGEEVDPLQEKRTGKLGKEGKELEKQQKKEAKERKKALKKEEERHRISGTDKLHKVKDKSVKHKKEKEKKKQKHRKESGSDSGSGSGCGSYYSDDSDSDSGSD